MVYNILSSSNNSIRRTNAHYIKLICDQMEKDKVEITISSVGQRCMEQFGKPATSTITNTGSKLGEYIRLRRSEQNLDIVKIINQNHVSNKLSDPILAQEVKILEESIKQLQIENNALRNTLKSLSVDIDGGIKAIFQGIEPSLNKELIQISSLKHGEPNNSLLSSAVLKLFDHLASRNYQLFRGRYGLNKKTVLSSPEFEVLKDACNISESEWAARYGVSDEGYNIPPPPI